MYLPYIGQTHDFHMPSERETGKAKLRSFLLFGRLWVPKVAS